MDLFRILNKNYCLTNIKVSSKDDLLQKAAAQAAKAVNIAEVTPDKIYNKLMEREKEGSTGFGNNIAIPHARVEGLKEFLILIFVSKKGVDFQAMDKKKVQLFFILIGPPEKVNEHLKIIASISRILAHSNVKRELLNAASPNAVYESFLKYSDMSRSAATAQKKLKLMTIVLYIEEYLYPILEFFIKEGIEGANIIESSGMGDYISNIPIFAEFIGFLKENRNRSKTIFVMVPQDRVNALISGIEEITGDLDKKDGAMILVQDVALYKGNMKMM